MKPCPVPLVNGLPPVQTVTLFTWLTRLSEVAPAGSVNVGVDVPPELLVMAAVVRPQLNSMLSGRPVIIPVVSRVRVVQVEVIA